MKTNPCLPIPKTEHAATAANAYGSRRAVKSWPFARLTLLIACLGLAGLTTKAQNDAAPPQATPLDTAAAVPAPDANGQKPEAIAASPVAVSSVSTNMSEQTVTDSGGTNGLSLNFRNAPIDLVLEHLSKAAGFIIVMETPVRGSLSVMGNGLTKDEAINLLNSELNKNGYAAIRSGERTLKIMTKSDAKTSDNPVKTGNLPSDIPNNDEMATWIIPIRFVDASQLMSDISPFVSSQATIIANQAGNSIVITDVQSNIRHVVEIIRAIDSSAEDVTEVKVFHLKYADPTEMSTLLAGLFPDQNGSAQAPFRFNGGRGGRGGFGGGPGAFFAAMANAGNSGNSQQDRIKKRTQVVAVADPRTSSLVVTATSDLMDQISEMVTQLDHPGKANQLAVIPIKWGDASQIMTALQDSVGATSSRSSQNNSQVDALVQRQQTQNQNNANPLGSSTGASGSRGGSRTGGGGGGGGFGGF